MKASELKPSLAGVNPTTGEIEAVGKNQPDVAEYMRGQGLIIVPVATKVARRGIGDVCDDIFALANEVAS